jgi:hypothetical protein
MKTQPQEFSRWLNCIPGEKRADLYFIPIVRGGKEPDVPRDTSWKAPEFRLSEDLAIQRLTRGGNVGFVPRHDLAAGDVDNVERCIELDLIPKPLDQTLTGQTRDGKPHLYFLDDGLENRDFLEHGEKILELRVNWRYVLAPGSYVPPTPGSRGDGLYRVVNECPPLVLKPDMLPWLKQNTQLAPSTPIKFAGKFMGLPCVKVLFEVKLDHNRQDRAAKLLSIAWCQDNPGNLDGFVAVAQSFAAFQSRPDSKVNPRNVISWARSVGQSKRRWNCGEAINLLRDNEVFPPCSGCVVRGG